MYKYTNTDKTTLTPTYIGKNMEKKQDSKHVHVKTKRKTKKHIKRKAETDKDTEHELTKFSLFDSLDEDEDKEPVSKMAEAIGLGPTLFLMYTKRMGFLFLVISLV